MAGWVKVETKLWNDEKFQQMPPLDKYLALYVLTGQSNRIGLFRFSVALAAEDTGLDVEDIRQRLARLCSILPWRYDSERRTLWMPTWWKYHSPGSSKTFSGWLADLDDIPQGPLKEEFAANTDYLSPALVEVLDRVCHRVCHRVSHTLSETGAPIDIDIDRDRDKEEPPKSPKGDWRSKALAAEIPESLAGNGFSKAWSDWVAHRSEIRKPLTPTSISKQLKRLAAMGPDRAAATIAWTIEKGWVGLREPESTPEPAAARGKEELKLRERLEGG